MEMLRWILAVLMVLYQQVNGFVLAPLLDL